MDLSYVLLFFVLFPLVYGLLLYKIPMGENLWVASVVGGVISFATALFLFISGGSIHVTLPLFIQQGIGFESTSFALIYGVITTFMWLISVIASKEYFGEGTKKLNRYYTSLFIVLSGSLGLFFAYDFFTLFVFFEVMSFTSYLWVIETEEESAKKASNIYLAFGLIGGLSILLGIFFLLSVTNDLRIETLGDYFHDEAMQDRAMFACQFLFFGFGAKAGSYFLHDYIPLAYVDAPAPATALLSSILSKCGLYGVVLVMVKIVPDILGFTNFVLVIALLNMFVGGLCGFLSGNMKRTLAFSSVSQVGFILWGIAMCNLLVEHNTYAAYGTMFHMINHSFIKMLLFVLAGVIYQNTKTLEYAQIKGFGKGKKVFQGLFLVGGLSLGAVPLFSGYVSKTLLHEAMVEYLHYYSTSMMYNMYEWVFLVSGGFTVAYMLKMYTCLFLEDTVETATSKTQYASPFLLISLSALAVIMVILGLFPNQFFGWIGSYTSTFFMVHEVDAIDYFTFANLKGSFTSLILGSLLYYGERKFTEELGVSTYQEKMGEDDNFIEKVYRPAIYVFSLAFACFARIFDVMTELFVFLSTRGFFQDEKIPDTFFHGADNRAKHSTMKLHITHSLAYSLLMFGLGFIFTIVYLLVVGGTVELDMFLG